jgi:PadR family transcriptional regulator PadR
MPALSYTALFILQALAQGHRFGFDVMDATDLPSGTVYPALRRLEAMHLVASDWENDDHARRASRPRRRYYELTKTGREQLGEAEARFRAVSKLFPKRSRA